MAETVVINIEANTSGLQTTIDALSKIGVIEKKIVDEFKATNEKNLKSLEDSSKKVIGTFNKVSEAVKNVKVDNETAKSLDLSAPVVKTANVAKTLKQQYREAVLEAQRLSAEFGENSKQALNAQKKAAALKDTIGDLNTRIQTLNPDAKFKSISNLAVSLQGVFYTATGSLQAFGIESEKLNQLTNNFQGLLGVLSGLNQITDIKDNFKNLTASLGITTQATEALTAAKEMNVEASAAEAEASIVSAEAKQVEVAATEEAVVAQQTLNTSILANPYVAVAAAIVALAAGIAIYASNSDDAAEKQEKLNKQVRDVTLNARASVEEELVTIDLLVKKYQDKNTTDKERLQISKKLNEVSPETVGWFNKEGKAIVDLTDKSKLLIEAKIKQAEAEAYIQEIARLNSENLKTQNKTVDESISTLDKFLAGTKALFTYGGGAATGVAYGVNQVTTATENNSKKIAENNKLIDIYKTKIGELGNAIATTNTTPDVNADFDKAIERSDKYYKKLKQSAAEKSKDDEEYSKLSEQITYLELENKLKIYKKYKKDTSDLELQLAEEDLKKKQKAFEEDKKNLEKAQKQREDIARNNSSSEQNFNELSVSLKSQSLQEQIELFKKYGKDYTQLQSELDQILLSKKVSPAEKDKKDYENALSLIEQYYNAQEVNILQNAKTKEAADTAIAQNEIEKLKEQIKAGEAFGQNVDELKKKLAELKFADVIESKKKDIEQQIGELLASAALDQITNAIAQNLENQLEEVNKLKEQQLENISEEEKALQDSYDRRQIGKRELEAKQKKFAQDRLDTEKKAELEISKIKQKQAIADKAAKIFSIAINTAKNAIEQPGPLASLVPFWIALGAAQAAIVLATPVPKYKKGTLSVPGYGNDDSVHAMLQPGEAVIPTEINKKYSTAIKAIYNGSVKPEEINNFVNMKMKRDYPSHISGGIVAKMDDADLYALGKIMKKNDGVVVKNMKELAELMSYQYNPRR